MRSFTKVVVMSVPLYNKKIGQMLAWSLNILCLSFNRMFQFFLTVDIFWLMFIIRIMRYGGNLLLSGTVPIDYFYFLKNFIF